MVNRFAVLTASVFASIGMISLLRVAGAQQPDLEKEYEDAKTARDEGRTDVACPKLERIVQIRTAGAANSTKGLGARLELGLCYEKQGKLASAAAQYLLVQKLAGAAKEQEQDVKAKATLKEREDRARTSWEAIQPTIALLIISVSADVAALPGFSINLDQRSIEPKEWGTRMPVDKGNHTVIATATGYDPQTLHVDIENEKTRAITIPSLKPTVHTPAVPASSSALPVTPATVLATRSIVPVFVMGGAAVAALAAGVALVTISGGDYEKAKTLSLAIKADKGTCGGANEHADCAALKKAAEQADALYAPGLGLLVGGAVLAIASGTYIGYTLRSGPAKTAAGPRINAVGVRGAGLLVQGSF